VGLEGAGFETIGTIEIDKRARATISANRPTWRQVGSGDVVALADAPGDLGVDRRELDVLAGGPPCQPFSMAAQWNSSSRMGMTDARAQTVVATMKLVGVLLPKYVMLENVAGFISGASSALPYIQSALQDIRLTTKTQYRVEHRTINAADFGVPQNRKRVVVILVRDDMDWDWPTPTHVERPVTAWDALGGLIGENPPTRQGNWTTLLESIPEGWNYQWLTSRGGGQEVFGYRTKYWNFLLKLARDKPSWTLAASPGPSTGPFHWDNRPLSSSEMKRLQSIPDSWTLTGSYREQVKQIGNATPSLLAQAMGKQLATKMGMTPSEGLRPFDRRDDCPSPTQPKAIPAHFEQLVGAKNAHAGEGKGPSPRLDRKASVVPA